MLRIIWLLTLLLNSKYIWPYIKVHVLFECYRKKNAHRTAAYSSVIPCLIVQAKCILAYWDFKNIDEKAREINANALEHCIKD